MDDSAYREFVKRVAAAVQPVVEDAGASLQDTMSAMRGLLVMYARALVASGLRARDLAALDAASEKLVAEINAATAEFLREAVAGRPMRGSDDIELLADSLSEYLSPWFASHGALAENVGSLFTAVVSVVVSMVWAASQAGESATAEQAQALSNCANGIQQEIATLFRTLGASAVLQGPTEKPGERN